MPPPKKPALPEMVELEIVRVPPLKMPPQLPKTVLSETMELLMLRVPVLLKAPPIPPPLKLLLAPETVRPDTDKFPPIAILKILKSRPPFPLLPLMLILEEPGPVMARVPAVEVVKIVGSAELSVMVPVTPVKIILSSDDAALASIIACLREPAPESLRFITGKVDGVILSSRVMSSSLEEMGDFLAFLFGEILKNLRKT